MAMPVIRLLAADAIANGATHLTGSAGKGGSQSRLCRAPEANRGSTGLAAASVHSQNRRVLRRAFGLVLLTTASTLWTASEALSAPTVVAVFDIEDARPRRARRLRPQALEGLTEYLATLLGQGGRFRVVPNDQLQTALRERKKESYRACYDQSCQIEIGKAIAAQMSLSTKIIQVGKKCMLVASLFDLRDEATKDSAPYKTACNVDALTEGLEHIARALRGGAGSAVGRGRTPPPPSKDYTSLESEISAAKARADEEKTERLANEKRAKEAWATVLEYGETFRIPAKKRLAAVERFIADFPSAHEEKRAAQLLLRRISDQFASRRLDSGLEIYVRENHAQPTVMVALVFKTGAGVQRRGQAGVVHLLEHVYFSKAWVRRAKALGAKVTFNADTGNDHQRFHLIVPPERLEDAVKLLIEGITDVDLSKKHVDRHRAVVEEELRRAASQPLGRLWDATIEHLYPGSDAKNVKGELKVKFGGSDLRRLLDGYYHPKLAGLFINGDVEPSAALDAAARAAADWGTKPAQRPRWPAPTRLRKSDAVLVRGEGPKGAIIVALQGPPSSDMKGSVAADIFMATSRADDSFFKKNLGANSFISYSTHRVRGMFSFGITNVEPSALEARLRDLKRTVRAMVDGSGLRSADIASGKKWLKPRAEKSMSRFGMVYWTHGVLRYPEEYVPTLEALGLDEVQTFLDEGIEGAPVVVGVQLSGADARRHGVTEAGLRRYARSFWK